MEDINFEKKEQQIDIMVNKYLDEKKIFENVPGYISFFWNIKKRFFKEIYNIDWQSPEDLDPNVIFD